MGDPDERTRRQVLAAAVGVSAVGVLGRAVADRDGVVGPSSASESGAPAGRTRPAGGPAVEWTRRYYSQAKNPTPDEDAQVWVKSVVRTPDGGFSLAGHQVYGRGTDDFVLLKTDAAGNSQWLREYDGAGDRDTAESHVRTADGGYLLVGQYRRGRSETPTATGTPRGRPVRRPWVVRTDAEGSERWRAEPGDDEKGELTDCAQADDGSLVAVGWVGDDADRAAWLLKLDSRGETVLDERYHSEDDGRTRTENAGGEPSYEDRFAAVAVANDGDLLLGGGGNQGGQVARVDPSGSPRWETDLGYQRATVGDVVEADDGDVVVTGRYYEMEDDHIATNTPNGSNLYVARLAADGSERWTTTVEGGANEGGRALVQTDDGGFAAVGESVRDDRSESEMFAAKVDGTGTERWSAHYPDEEDHPNDRGTDLVQTDDGGYAVAARPHFRKLAGGYTPTATDTPESETATDTQTSTDSGSSTTEDGGSATPSGTDGDGDLSGAETTDTATGEVTDNGGGEGDCTI